MGMSVVLIVGLMLSFNQSATLPKKSMSSQTSAYSYVEVGVIPKSAQAGIKPLLSSDQYKEYLYLIDPKLDKNSVTGFLIPKDLKSAVDNLDAMLPARVKSMIKNRLHVETTFECSSKIWPHCFAGYYNALSHALVKIWALDRSGPLRNYFEAHGVCTVGKMVGTVVERLYKKLTH